MDTMRNLLIGVVVTLGLASAAYANPCDRFSPVASAQTAENDVRAWQDWMVAQNLAPNTREYDLVNVAYVLYVHARQNCTNRFEALPASKQTQEGFTAFIVPQFANVKPYQNESGRTMVPANMMHALLQQHGLQLGLPEAVRSTGNSAGSRPKSASGTNVRRGKVPAAGRIID